MSKKSDQISGAATPQLMQLEQRLMFDGAAVETTAEALGEFTGDSDIVEHIDTGVFTLAVAYEEAQPAAEIAQAQVKEFLTNASAQELFEIFNGGKTDIYSEWLQSMEAVRQSILSEQFDIEVQLLDNESMQGHLGAFAAEGSDGTAVIYLNESYLANFGDELAAKVLIEELGHAIDAAVNNGADTAGDEGQLFADRVQGISDSASTDSAISDNDHGDLIIGGENIAVEFAAYQFINAYEMVYDIDNDAAIDTTERWAEKEQNLHYFNTTSLVGSGEKITIDDNEYDSSYFSGNDVSAIGINIGGTTYYGWVSRPIKAQGVVRGFYFWTDNDFNDPTKTREENLASAQSDGNQDADRDETDNRGFILVVDQAWFTQQITDTGVSNNTINNAKDGDLTAGITVANVGSSSDRVDSALNALIDAGAVNNNPVANDDTSDVNLSAGTAGGPALEEGEDLNSPSLNNQVSSGILTATVDAQGNVILNGAGGDTADTDEDGDTITITEISSTSQSSSVSGSTTISGKYGSLTIDTDGSYTYDIDNTLTAVQALRTTSNTLDDAFTYTIADGRGGSDTAVLTIKIQGSNDAPLANDDYNIAKESLTSELPGGSVNYDVNDPLGFTATGNVLPNDTDVDSGDAKTILGYGISGSISEATVNNTGSFDVQFDSNAGASLKNTSIGSEVYLQDPTDDKADLLAIFVAADPDTPLTGDDLTNNAKFKHVTVLSITEGTDADGNVIYDLGLSSNPKYYWNGSTYVQITDFAKFINPNDAGYYSNQFRFAERTEVDTPTDATRQLAWNTGGVRDATSSVGDTVQITTLTSFGFSGTLAIGMNVLDADDLGGVPAGTTIKAINYNIDGSVQSIILDTSGDVTATNFDLSGSITNDGTPQTLQGRYGVLSISGDGSYTYTPYADTSSLSEGDSEIETFDYTMQDTAGAKSSAQLIITVYGSGTNDPIADADTDAADEQGYHSDKTSVLDAGSAATGNVLSNDSAPSGANKVTTAGKLGATNTAVTNGTTSSNGLSITADFGTIVIGSDGTYAYTVDNTDATVDALAEGETLTETFAYTIENGGSGISASTLTITITGANDAPIATDDGLVAYEDSVVVTANVLTNDTDVDTGDTKAVIEAIAGSNDDVSNANLPIYTAVTVGGVDVTGNYGTLTIKADGSISYAVDNSNSTVQALNTLSPAITDTFTYRMEDSAGEFSDAILTVTINGAADAPINSFNGSDTFGVSVTTTINTAASPSSFDFSSANSAQLQVSDVDGDLSKVILHVDHGTLAIGTAGSATVTGDGSADLVITGTQAQINSALATLGYTPDQDYTGSDFLTIFSQDSQNKFDSDGVQINIPTVFNGPTVSESDLSSGSNPSGTDETDTATLTAPTGQTFNGDQTGSGTYGTWSLTASTGVFSYTLTSSANHASGAVTETFDIETIDEFGNVVINKVIVTINDDSPTANADARSVTEGTSAAAAVNLTGNVVASGATGDVADTTGADTTVTVTKAGTSSANTAVTSSTTSANGLLVTGSYGSLTIGADGSYVYDLDDTNTTVDALATGSSLTETFTYEVTDSDGDTSTATLTITINGVTDGAPGITVTDNNGADSGDESVAENATLSGKTFTVTASAGLTKITLGGTDVTLAELNALGTTPKSITLTNGSMTLTGYDSTTGAVTYSYDPTGTSTDHSGGAVSESISLVVTDNNGATANDTLGILITDTAPSAANDARLVTEGTSAAAAANLTGNVVANGATGDVADTTGADTAITVTQAGTSSANTAVTASTTSADGLSITGTYGSLVIGADGSYVYDLDDTNATVDALATGSSLTDTFTYEITDSDGDMSTATLTITINGITDGLPGVTVTDNNGADSGDESVEEHATLTGKTFTVSASAGLTKITVAGTDVTLAELNALGTTPKSITLTNGSMTLTGYDSTTGAVTYSYDPTGTSTDHSGGAVSESISIVVTDNNGVTASDTLGILITDTSPVAANDARSVTEGTSVAAAANLTGNVVANGATGDVADTTGADTAITVTQAGTSSANTAVTASTTSADGLSITGTYGSLVIGADGSYVYDLDDTNATVDALATSSSLTETFTYEITDSDGDTSTATLTITINGVTDGAPGITVTDNNGADSGDESVAENATLSGKTFTVTATAGLTKITVGSTDVTLAELNALGATPKSITLTNGSMTLTGYDSTTGAVTYSYDPTGTSTDHSGGAVSESISLVVTDSNGATANDTLGILITDTAPSAANDARSVTEGTSAAAAANLTGNVVANGATGDVADTTGADTAITVTQAGTSSANTAVISSTTSADGLSITGTYGSLVIGADGSYVYDLDDTNATVDALATGSSLTDTFTYEITDSDGDTSTATLTITINGVTDVQPSADLLMSKTVDNASPNLGDNVTFTLSVTNNGPDNATGVEVSDALPAGFTFVSDNGATAATYDDSTGVWTIGNLANGASATLEIVATATDSSAVTNTATVTADQTDPDNTDNTDNATVDAVGPLTVNSVTVNELSPFAVFTVTGEPNQSARLALTNASGAATSEADLRVASALPTIQYWNGIQWTDYDASNPPALNGSGELSVRVAIDAEQEAALDGPETFKLQATNVLGASNSGTATIVDNGTGTKFEFDDNNDGTPNLTTGPSPALDDDRPLSVNDIEVNEGTGHAVFTVSGVAGQYTKLELVVGSATTEDFGPGLEYWDGNTWKLYTPGSFVRLDSAGKLFVRTPIVNDDILEGAHSFELRATNTGGSSDLGSATIYDDGTGVKQVFTNGVLMTSTVGLDDDTPAPPPQPAPAAFTAPEPPPAEEPVVEVPEPVPAPAADVVLEQPDNELIVMRNIPEQRFSAGDGFTTISYQIPTDTFGHTETETEITLSALMATGEDLPKWLIFDPEKGEFRGIPPEGFSGTLIIRVVARDANGDQVETMVTIEVISNAQTSVSVGKADLFAQLQSDSQFSWRAARDQLVQAAKRMRG